MQLPSLTVLIPAFEAASTLSAAVESALGQTHPPAEILVVDDGSTDDTASVAALYGEPVRLISKENGGTASARNLGIREAVGEVVAFLDADDLYRPTHLEEIARTLRDRPELAGAGTDAELRSPSRTWRNGSFRPAHDRGDLYGISSPVIFCALGIRRDVLRELGEFDSRFTILEDVEMYHRLICNGHLLGYVDSPSYIYNIHGESKSQRAHAARGRRELLEINLRYLVARPTPLRYRPRLAVRAVRNAVHMLTG